MDILKNAQKYATEHTKYIEPKRKNIFYWVSIKDAYVRGAKDQQAEENTEIKRLKEHIFMLRLGVAMITIMLIIYSFFVAQ